MQFQKIRHIYLNCELLKQHTHNHIWHTWTHTLAHPLSLIKASRTTLVCGIINKFKNEVRYYILGIMINFDATKGLAEMTITCINSEMGKPSSNRILHVHVCMHGPCYIKQCTKLPLKRGTSFNHDIMHGPSNVHREKCTKLSLNKG